MPTRANTEPPQSATRDLSIRGHHILCILGFRSLGYDRRFVQNMGELVATIRRRPDVVLVLTDGCDDICAACPHNEGGRCRKKPGAEEEVRRADRAVLAGLGLRPGRRHTAREVYKTVAAEISPTAMGRELCTNCEWRELGYCTAGLEALRQGELFARAGGSLDRCD